MVLMSDKSEEERNYPTDSLGLIYSAHAMERIAYLANRLRTVINSKDMDWESKNNNVSGLITEINTEHIKMMGYGPEFPADLD